MVSFVLSFGQQLPNNDFEDWESTNNYQNPKHWNTPNVFTSLAGIAVVDRSDNAYSGNYSARLESKVISFLGQTLNNQLAGNDGWKTKKDQGKKKDE